MEITKDTKLKDLISTYPWLKDEMAKVNDKFKMLNTPVGKVMLGKATITEMSKKIRHGRRRSHKQDTGSYQSA